MMISQKRHEPENSKLMTLRSATTAELAILVELWQTERMTVKDLAKKLYSSSTPSDIATVQKLLGRLEGKKCVGRDRENWPQEFFATIQRDELVVVRLQAIADELCEGAMGTLLTHLVHSQQLNARERQRLRKLLDGLETKKK